MKTLLRPALSLFVLLSLITGLVYPALVTGIARFAFPAAASGGLIVRDGQLVGSELIGQNFSDAKYFWGRPSATSPQPYNAAASSGSNQGPLNPALVDAVRGRAETLRAADPASSPNSPNSPNSANSRPLPIELLTASASGLDPHISPAAAEYQVERVAHARGLEVQSVRQLVARHSEDRDFGLFGAARVNVLKLNLALDAR